MWGDWAYAVDQRGTREVRENPLHAVVAMLRAGDGVRRMVGHEA
jgi:hypothetical protein